MPAKKRTRKAKPKPVKRKAGKPGGTGVEKNPMNGRFLPGNNGGSGRPKGIDFKHAVAKHAVAEGIDLDAAAWDLARKLHARAMEGDTQAAKLWLDRCCGLQKQELDVTQTATITHITDQDRNAIRDMAADPDTQRVVRAELRKKTRGNGRG